MLRHPLVKGILLVVIFIVAAEIAVALTSYAWADVLLPIPFTPITVSLGELPQWVIAFVAGAGLWKSWRIEQHVAAVASSAKATAADMKDVRHETNSMRAALEEAKLAEGRLLGRKELHSEIAERAVTDKERVAVEKEDVRADAIHDAETQAKIDSIKSGTEKTE